MNKEQCAKHYVDKLTSLINRYPAKGYTDDTVVALYYKGKLRHVQTRKISIPILEPNANIRAGNFRELYQALERLDFNTEILFVRKPFNAVLTDEHGPEGVHQWYVRAEFAIMTLPTDEEKVDDMSHTTPRAQSSSGIGHSRRDHQRRDHPQGGRKEGTEGHGSRDSESTGT